jgi:hypothetical protein
MKKESAPEQVRSRRRRRAIVGFVLLAMVASYATWRHIVPSGLGGVTPYLVASANRGDFVSPGNSHTVTVYSNDAGAAHSGHFWTWVVEREWHGLVVVAKGYLDESTGPVPLRWKSQNSFVIDFVAGRYDGTTAPMEVDLGK